MERPDDAELARIPLLQALEGDQLRRLSARCWLRRLAEHERLFDLGQPATHFFYLRQGLLKLLRTSPDGAEKVIHIVHPEETFAEAVIFSEEASGYPVTCEALAPSEVIAIDGATMVGLLKASPDASLRMLSQLSRRLRWQVQEIENLTLHNATYRLVGYLLRLADDRGDGTATVRLSMPKHVLASRLNIQPETLSRIFARLSRDGLIEVQGLDVALLDAEALEQLVEL